MADIIFASSSFGDGNKKINLIDMLFGQQFLIRSIAIKHDSILKLFSQLRRALLISFDQLHAVVFFPAVSPDLRQYYRRQPA
ncbi:hypothetical protein HR12_30270 [Microbacterium sp. SUBG005]|nr:hypothetical protein HR12_30270 [Microbacterium sp. SUBG005]